MVRGGVAGGCAESLGAGGLEERQGPGAETRSERGPSLGMWEVAQGGRPLRGVGLCRLSGGAFGVSTAE